MTHWFLRLATLYGVVGIGLGLYMSATNDFAWHPVHAHLNLLGWVTLALFGLFYRSHPHAAAGKLATAHFWLFVPAHFVQMATPWLFFAGKTSVEPLLAASSFVVGAGFLCFTGVVWRTSASGSA